MELLTFFLLAIKTFAVNISVPEEPKNNLISFEALKDGHWRIRNWQRYPFIFLSYGGSWSNNYKRAAHECFVQKLLTPTWKDPNFQHPIESSATEWGWNLRPECETRKQCYEWFREIYLDKTEKRAHSHLPIPENAPFYSVTGHSWFSVYGAQWGCDMIGLETGENIIAMQAQIAFLRGAARQNGKPFYVQPSQWYGGTIPLFTEGEDEYTPHELDKEKVLAGIKSGGIAIPNGGHSPSLLSRMWYVAWLSGAAIVCPENCQANFFTGKPEENWSQPEEKRIPLSPIGKRAQTFMQITKSHPDIGIPYTPFALLLDEFTGFNGFPLTQPRPWNALKPSIGDREISLFLDTLFPRSMYIDFIPGVDVEQEDRRLVKSSYGDCFDVLLSNVSLEVLKSYPIVICLGEHEFLPETLETIKKYLQTGGKLFLTYTQAEKIKDTIPSLQNIGDVGFFGLQENDLPTEIDHTRWFTPAHWGADEETLAARKEAVQLLPYEKKFKSEVRQLMSRLSEKYLPIKVLGDIQFLINKTPNGWIVGLVNNEGVTKGNMTPVKIDYSKKRTITIYLKYENIKALQEWYTKTDLEFEENRFSLDVPPGEVRIVEIQTTGK